MISRRTVIGGAGAALLAGAAIVTIGLTEKHRPRNAKDMAPNFSVEPIGGGRHYQLADFAGGVLLLNFWATWCAPCRIEMPWLSRTYTRFHLQGLTILGVNMDDGDMPAVQRFAHEMGVTYPIARNNDAIVAAYGGLRFLPQSFLIGRDGEVLQHIFGMPASTHDVEAAIMTALSRK